MANELIQLAIGLAIAAAVVWTSVKHGRANPESTGRLGRRLNEVDNRLKAHIASSKARDAKVEQLEHSIRDMAGDVARKGDIKALQAELGADRELNRRTFNAVDRLERSFLDRAINGKDN